MLKAGDEVTTSRGVRVQITRPEKTEIPRGHAPIRYIGEPYDYEPAFGTIAIDDLLPQWVGSG
jgi:hypothetical protein